MRTLNPIKSVVVMALVAGLALTCFVVQVSAQESIQINLARMVDESQNVVLARVTSVTSEKHPQYQNLDTVVVTLQVIEALKGSPGAQLTFRQYVFDFREVASNLNYRAGEELVLLLRQPSQSGLTSPVGFDQGRFRVERDAANNRLVRNGLDNIALFDGAEQTSPGLKPRLSAAMQRLMTEHREGPLTYEQLKTFVQSEVAARQAVQ